MGAVRHLYVHLPFCAHRCGYCDFVTILGREGDHGPYADALAAELALEREYLASRLDTVFLGGGTPTFTEPDALRRVLRMLPRAREVTVEANPETVKPELARLLRDEGVTRVSLGAQSFRPHLLSVLERRARPDDVRRAFYHLRDAGFDNISLDLIYGIPGQSASDLEADIDEALALGPEHVSCYELEAKRGTRFTHAHGLELERQAEALEGYFETVVDRLTAAGYRWYETANFCLEPGVDGGRDLRSHHNLAYWLGRDYVGLGIGAVSTVAGRRWRNTPRLPAYLEALERGAAPTREVEELGADVRRVERLMLGLRLDEPLRLEPVADAVDPSAVARMEQLGLLTRPEGDDALALTKRGRLLGGGVTAELLAVN
jgi:putative oxygen-independent coproporphyrinogen III oxidase